VQIGSHNRIAISRFSSGWRKDDHFALRRALNVQTRIRHAKRPVLFVGPLLVTAADRETRERLRELQDLLHTHSIAA
jgi:CO dehydrogenase/acetyl-CoA synthase epsilon subunit